MLDVREHLVHAAAMQLLLLLLPHGAAEERQERPARQQVDDGDGHEDQSVKDGNH